MEKKIEKVVKKLVTRHYPVVILLVLPLLFFIRAALGLDLIVAGDFSGSDLLDLHLPFKAAIQHALKNHYLPLWTPYLDGGYPLLAEGQMGFFYPINLLLGLLTLKWSLNYSLILALTISGLTSYFYARETKAKAFASLVAAVSFTFSAFFIARIKHLNLINVASLFPLGMLLIEKFFQKLKLRYWFYLGLVLSLQILAGHPQMAFYCLLVYLAAVSLKAFIYFRRKGNLPLGRVLTGLVVTGLVGSGLSAIQILPTIEMTWLSSRPGYVFEQIAMYPFHPKNLITFLSPYFFGNPAAGTYRPDIRQMGIFWENASYIGLLPLGLFLYALYHTRKYRKNINQKSKDQVNFYFSLFTFSLLLMLGRYTPLFNLTVNIIPLANLFRFPTRFNLFAIFAMSMLAGHGASLIIGNIRQTRFRRWEWPLSVNRTKILIFFLIFIDLFSFSRDYVGSLKAGDWLKPPRSVEILKQDTSLFRIYSVTQYSESPYQTLGWKTMTEPLVSIREAVPPNHNLIYRIGTISDRSWFEGGLPVLRHYQFENWLLNDVKNEFILGKVLGMFNVKYLLTYAQTGNPEFQLKEEIDLGEIFGSNLKIYENLQNMGPVYYVPEAKIIKDETQVLKEMADLNFYPPKTVILEEEPAELTKNFSGILDDFKEDNRLEIEDYQPLEIRIKAELTDPGFLVLPDTPYPGWQATVDNQNQKILNANFLMRALELKPGDHQIVFKYQPNSFIIGAIISSTTLAVLAFIALALLIKKLLKK